MKKCNFTFFLFCCGGGLKLLLLAIEHVMCMCKILETRQGHEFEMMFSLKMKLVMLYVDCLHIPAPKHTHIQRERENGPL